jgi:hypothetical protein
MSKFTSASTIPTNKIASPKLFFGNPRQKMLSRPKTPLLSSPPITIPPTKSRHLHQRRTLPPQWRDPHFVVAAVCFSTPKNQLLLRDTRRVDDITPEAVVKAAMCPTAPEHPVSEEPALALGHPVFPEQAQSLAPPVFEAPRPAAAVASGSAPRFDSAPAAAAAKQPVAVATTPHPAPSAAPQSAHPSVGYLPEPLPVAAESPCVCGGTAAAAVPYSPLRRYRHSETHQPSELAHAEAQRPVLEQASAYIPAQVSPLLRPQPQANTSTKPFASRALANQHVPYLDASHALAAPIFILH